MEQGNDTRPGSAADSLRAPAEATPPFRKGVVVINPISGTRSKEGLEEIILDRLRGSGVQATALYTRGPQDASRLAREAASAGCDLVVVAGGDGTVNQVAGTLCQTDVKMGIVPCGSGNGLARTFEIPQSPQKAMDIILKGWVEECDYGTVNGLPFFCTFGVGFDAAVAEKFAGSKRRGKLTYLRKTLEEYLSYRPASYTLQLPEGTEVREAFLIAVCNVSQYGNNVYIAPEASPTDGLLDITLVRNGTPAATAMAGIGMLAGTFGPNKTIESYRVNRAIITRTDDGPVQLDGEPREMGRRLEVECHRGALKMVVPRTRHKFKPIITPIQAMFTDVAEDIRHILGAK